MVDERVFVLKTRAMAEVPLPTGHFMRLLSLEELYGRGAPAYRTLYEAHFT